ncbi:MAG TPA: penicillin acylase family protein, partial [Longimicrobiales bacterium]|nr:penicillin acylase family protein [Longimicrobiales bacterium]
MNGSPLRLVVAASCAVIVSGCSFLNPPAPAPVETVAPQEVQPLQNTGRVELLWDTYGVPHIIAQDPAALFYGMGWAQMRSHGDLLLRLYGQARGRAAEYWGADFIDSDVWVRTNSVPGRAEQWLAAQPAHMRAYVDAFVSGLNAYAARHPDSLSAVYRRALPIRSADVLAHQQRVLNFTFVANAGMMSAARGALGVPGSNAWAVGPDRSDQRNAMLLANPHLPWSDLFTWYEAHMVAPELDAYGATLVGLPALTIAFNPNLGWTHTVNTMDGADLYELQTNGDYYLFDGEMRAMTVNEQVLRVRQPDGTIAEQPLRVRGSVHGPIIASQGNRAIALSVTGLDAPLLMQQYWDMMRAGSLRDFEFAMSRLQLPMFTTIYADRAGNIMHLFNGRVPVRRHGDWNYWQGIVRGDTSATQWAGTHSYGALPRVLNPPSGWVHNSNEPPWTATLPMPLDPAFFPDYMAPPPSMSFRAQRSARMLEGDASITFNELITYKHSTRLEAADHFLLDLIAAARQSSNADARAAAEVLEQWDRNADADSRGAVLFVSYLRAMQQQQWPSGSPWEIDWTARAPLATPDGLADPPLAVALLGRVAQQVRATYGSIDVPWGDVYRLRRDSLDLPANGGPGEAGAFRVTEYRPAPADSTRFIATFGDSYVLAVEFSTPIRARSLLTYGNASQAGSPHRTDQLGLYARKELKP